MKRMNLRVLAGLGAVLLVTMAMSAPAFAGGKANKGNDAGSGYTEDNDSNDNGTANNVSDDGDNAHPSGKDKSVENGNSGNQGKSTSDPDGDSNGGADKPNGSGGTDKADQDGNNGCGNDDDFEDDNNGNCGKPVDKKTDKPCIPSEVKSNAKAKAKAKANGKGKGKAKTHAKLCTEPAITPEVDGDEVEGTTETEPVDPDDVLGGVIGGGPDAEDDDVLGSITTRDDADVAAAGAEREAGNALPFTGAAILTLVALAGGLLALGALFLSKRKARI